LPFVLSGPDSTGRAAGLVFSHRSHLARTGTRCLDCHDLVRSSTRAEDRNLPPEKACLGCHDGTRARRDCTLCHASPAGGRLPDPPRRAYRFDHALHAGLGDVGPVLAAALRSGRYLGRAADLEGHLESGDACQACHRGLGGSRVVSGPHLPRMADCQVCHTQTDPPFGCAKCHTSDAVLRPASHAGNFADLHSSAREVPDKSGCKQCHGVGFTCMGCH
jgi:hypothetical protein